MTHEADVSSSRSIFMSLATSLLPALLVSRHQLLRLDWVPSSRSSTIVSERAGGSGYCLSRRRMWFLRWPGFAAISIERWSRRPTIDPQFISVATRDYPGRAAFQCGIGKRSVLVVYFRRGNLSVADLAQPDLGLPLLIAGFSMAVARFKLLPVLPLGEGRLALLVFEPYRGRALSKQGEDRLRIHVAGVQGSAGATGAG